MPMSEHFLLKRNEVGVIEITFFKKRNGCFVDLMALASFSITVVSIF